MSAAGESGAPAAGESGAPEPPALFRLTPLSQDMQEAASGKAAASEKPAGKTRRDADSGPEIGIDIKEVRRRVLGEDAEAPSESQNREVYDVYKKQHQVDLNEEGNAAALEDPTLKAHMESARRRLSEHETAILRLPKREELRTQYLAAMRGLSDAVRRLDEQHMAVRENVEVSHRQAQSLAGLAQGQAPRGFKAFTSAALREENSKENLVLAAEKADEVARSYDTTSDFIETLKDEIFLLRRKVEGVGDGLLSLIEACEEDRRLLREYLMMASKTQAGRESAAPAETRGERLLALADLPEESGFPATEHGD